MPIYEYTCPACGTRFEAIKKLGEDSAPCPRCGGTAEKVAARPAAARMNPATAPIPAAAALNPVETNPAIDGR
jgi:putative FmdB family regulatory protein